MSGSESLAVGRVIKQIDNLNSGGRTALFRRIEKASPRYLHIIRFHGNIARDEGFQRAFNGFYQVRRNLAWRTRFYKLLQDLKRLSPKSSYDLRHILEAIHAFPTKCFPKRSKQWEYSFATKMLHALNTSQPIVDSKVLDLLSMPKPTTKELQPLLDHYANLCKVMKALIAEPAVKRLLKEFDKELPRLKKISRMKKLDFILWQFK